MEMDTGKGSFLGQGRILIMDDEEIIRNFLCDALRHLGYEVESAINGAEAIELYKRASELVQPFNAVILDLTVAGGIGGKETVKELLKIDPEANVIVSSGYSNDPIMAEYDKYGFKGVVAKPFMLKELSKVVYKVIKGISE
ncbi:MAG: response regulator [Nitrospirae bacterium]|nr:response regulator [Nitrospirota bacterium]